MSKNQKEQNIIRVQKKTRNFSIIDNRFTMDNRISWKAKGILTYLLTKPDDWQVYLSDLAKQSKDGIDSVKSGLRELKDAGYVIHKKIRDEKGRIVKHEYIVFEVPQSQAEQGFHPEVENPLMDKPLEDNRPLLSTEDKLNTDKPNIDIKDDDDDQEDLEQKNHVYQSLEDVVNENENFVNKDQEVMIQALKELVYKKINSVNDELDNLSKILQYPDTYLVEPYNRYLKALRNNWIKNDPYKYLASIIAKTVGIK